MLTSILNKAYNETCIYYLLFPLKLFYTYIRVVFVKDVTYIQNRYKKVFGRQPDLISPTLLSEKIQWLKLNNRTDLHTLCADKFSVRRYVADKVGSQYLIPLIYTTKIIQDVKPENLPDIPMVVKVNHDSGGTILIHDKQTANFRLIRRVLKRKLARNYYYLGREWQYKDIDKMILVEEMLLRMDGVIAYDIKIHCFNGRAHFIQVDLDRYSNHKRNFYDLNWEPLPFCWCPAHKGQPLWGPGCQIEKPKNLNVMIEIAESLSVDFPLARIDLYNLNGKIYFGEITFHHGSGFEAFFPDHWDGILGKKLILPIDLH